MSVVYVRSGSTVGIDTGCTIPVGIGITLVTTGGRGCCRVVGSSTRCWDVCLSSGIPGLGVGGDGIPESSSSWFVCTGEGIGIRFTGGGTGVVVVS